MENTKKISKIQQKMLNLLKETSNHYNSNNRSLLGRECVYVPRKGSKSEGCAIGRNLPEEFKILIKKRRLNKRGVTTLIKSFSDRRIPEILTYNVNFLAHLQCFHDFEYHWNVKGMSNEGKDFFNYIKSNILNNYYE